MKTRKPIVLAGLWGTLLGFTLSRLGFTRYHEVNAMFTFADFRLFLSFVGAVSILVVYFFFFKNRFILKTGNVSMGIVIGSILFGLGWAATGTCPAVALVQIGEGRLFGVMTTIGIFLGAWLFKQLNKKYWRFDVTSCGE